MKKFNVIGYAFSLLLAFVASFFGCGALMAMASGPVPGNPDTHIPTYPAGHANAGQPKTQNGAEGIGTHTSTQGATEGLNTDDIRKGAPGLIVDPLDQEIVKMQQTSTPIDQITRHASVKETQGMVYQFYSVDQRVNKAIGTAVTGADGTQEATSGNFHVATITTDSADLFDETDVLLLPQIPAWDEANSEYFNANVAAQHPLRVIVREVTASGLEVQAINGKPSTTRDNQTTIAVASLNTVAQATGNLTIIRLGHAAPEGDVLTANSSVLPKKQENYMQIFKGQVIESSIAAASQTEVKWDRTEQNLYMMNNLRQEIETTFIFGKKGYTYNSKIKRPVYTTSGLLEQIVDGGGHVIEIANIDALTEKQLINMQRLVHVGNSGSNRRLMIAGSRFVAGVAALDSITRNINAGETERIFGMEWNKIKSNFGVWNMIMHPLFDQIPGWEGNAIIIDPQHLSKRVFKSMWNQLLDLKSSGVYDGEGNVLTEISSICLKYPKCHALVLGKYTD